MWVEEMGRRRKEGETPTDFKDCFHYSLLLNRVMTLDLVAMKFYECDSYENAHENYTVSSDSVNGPLLDKVIHDPTT